VVEADKVYESGFVLFPNGHSKSQCKLDDIMKNKFRTLGALSDLSAETVDAWLSNYLSTQNKDNKDLRNFYNIKIKNSDGE